MCLVCATCRKVTYGAEVLGPGGKHVVVVLFTGERAKTHHKTTKPDEVAVHFVVRGSSSLLLHFCFSPHELDSVARKFRLCSTFHTAYKIETKQKSDLKLNLPHCSTTIQFRCFKARGACVVAGAKYCTPRQSAPEVVHRKAQNLLHYKTNCFIHFLVERNTHKPNVFEPRLEGDNDDDDGNSCTKR